MALPLPARPTEPADPGGAGGAHLRFLAAWENPKAEYIEPNPHLTPDFRWVLFTAHLKGTANDVYAVEIPNR